MPGPGGGLLHRQGAGGQVPGPAGDGAGTAWLHRLWPYSTKRGTEFTSKVMFFWSRDKGVKLDFIQPGKPTQNAFVESFNGKFRGSCLNQHWFRSLDEARAVM